MQGRMGTYDKRPYEPNKTDPEISGVQDQATRLRFIGGNRQQERMIKEKRRTLDHAVWNSYQAAEVLRIDADYRQPVRALINPNKLKQDYDDKIISIGYEYNFKCGDVFEWLGTNTHWLIYLQDLTELAYFRGDIRKCSYKISWNDNGEINTSYAAIRGPVETKINYMQKHNISLDLPNHSLNMLLPLNDKTLKYFQRYSKFYLQTDHPAAPQLCWRVEGIDWISTPGILEITAVEYYSNETEDNIEQGLVGDLIVEVENPNEPEIEIKIVGETFIKPKKTYTFTFTGKEIEEWRIDPKFPIVWSKINDKTIELKWDSTFSGQFEIGYGNYVKTIVVESLF